jgi:hypothetical protein
MHPDYGKGLLRLQADLDQQKAEAESPVVSANEALRDLERTRAEVEGKLRTE